MENVNDIRTLKHFEKLTSEVFCKKSVIIKHDIDEQRSLYKEVLRGES